MIYFSHYGKMNVIFWFSVLKLPYVPKFMKKYACLTLKWHCSYPINDSFQKLRWNNCWIPKIMFELKTFVSNHHRTDVIILFLIPSPFKTIVLFCAFSQNYECHFVLCYFMTELCYFMSIVLFCVEFCAILCKSAILCQLCYFVS